MRPEYVVENCLLPDIESLLIKFGADYDLISFSTCQVGSGFGAHVEATLIFKRCAANQGQIEDSQRKRRSPIQPIYTQNKKFDTNSRAAVSQ